MSTNPKQCLTLEEYLNIERASEERYEYYAGEIFLMSGGSPNHNAIIFNINTSLGSQIKGRRCRGFAQSQRVLINKTGLYTYPDVIIVCNQPVFAHDDTLINPTLIVEVLSPSTENYDKGTKFDHYRSVESLAEYLIVAQDKYHVMHYARRSSHEWRLTEFRSADEVIELPSLESRLLLNDVYDGVDFATPAEPQGNVN